MQVVWRVETNTLYYIYMTLIGCIRGQVLSCDPETVLIDVRGIGYQIHTTTHFHAVEGAELILWTHLAVRENSLDLYGFPERSTRDLFVLLLNIPKVGPKSALQILNKASETLIWECAGTNDHKRLAKTSGLGAKTAEKVVLELADQTPTAMPNSDMVASNNTQDITEALIALGYPERDAYNTIATLQTDYPETLTDQATAIKTALQLLSR